MCADTTTTPDYRSTVFLPETEFPMRAGLPQHETYDLIYRHGLAIDASGLNASAQVLAARQSSSRRYRPGS